MVCNNEYRCNGEEIYSICSGIPHLKKIRLMNISRLLTNNPKMSGNWKNNSVEFYRERIHGLVLVLGNQYNAIQIK